MRDDTERLDWLEQERCTVYRSHNPTHWVVVVETKKPRSGVTGSTLRSAIDKAKESK